MSSSLKKLKQLEEALKEDGYSSVNIVMSLVKELRSMIIYTPPSIHYPNKIYACEYTGENSFGEMSHFLIVIAALNEEIAKEWVKDTLNINCEVYWLMNGVYPTIYTHNGKDIKPIQAKILFTSSVHYKK
jgi:hypothetical protein